MPRRTGVISPRPAGPGLFFAMALRVSPAVAYMLQDDDDEDGEEPPIPFFVAYVFDAEEW